jgi:hypothetical protein
MCTLPTADAASGSADALRLNPSSNVPCSMGARFQEIARLRTMEFLIEQAIVMGAGHPASAAQLDVILATIRAGLVDLPVDDDDVV